MTTDLTLDDYMKLSDLRLLVTKKNRKFIDKNYILQKFSISPPNMRRYVKGERSLPIKYLLDNPGSLIQVMKTRPIFITNGGIKVTLPNKINDEIAYLAGLVCGDGNLLLTKKGEYRITIFNKERAILKKALKILKENFNYSCEIRKSNKCLCIKIGSKVIFSFFNKIMNIESGKKINIVIPKKIKENRKLVRSFIAGFFDAEGSIGLKKNNITCQIMIYQKQKQILEEIRDELIKDGIKMKLFKKAGNCWVLYGNKDSLRPFFKKIKFSHPKKISKLKTAIRSAIN